MTYNLSFRSPNFNERKSTQISLIIVHYTDMLDAKEALTRLCDPQSQASAHYLIHKSGEIFQLVEDSKRAWHAGKSYWQGLTDINDISLGIELDNTGHSGTLEPYPKEQISTLISLLESLCKAYNINPSQVIGHSDISPSRKEDPGEHFPWEKIKEYGFGLWPSSTPLRQTPETVAEIQELLSKIGYDCPLTGEVDDKTKSVITAFQRHFTPKEITGSVTNSLRHFLSFF